MDKLFNDIGLDNVNVGTNEKSRYPSNDMFIVDEAEIPKEEKRYTKDGRDRDKFSIVFKPDENKFPNPDNTGNGIDTTPEIGSREAVGNIEKPKFIEETKHAKSLINHTYDSLTEIRSKLKIIMSHFYHETTTNIDEDLMSTSETIYKNLVNAEIRSPNKNSYNSKSNFSFFDCKIESFGNLYINFINVLNKLNFSDPNLTLDKNDSLSLLTNKDNENILLKKLGIIEKNYVSISNMFKSWEHVKTMVLTLNNIYVILKDMDISKVTYDNGIKLKSTVPNCDNNQLNTINNITKRIYITSIVLNKLLDIVDVSLINFFKQITPKNQFEFYVEPNKLMFKVDKLNPWVSTDYHLLKELRKAEGTLEFTRKILEMHNAVVKPNDLFLFLGDLSESEFFTENDLEAQRKLIETCRLLHGKKIMIIGNNDVCNEEFLKKCGFIEVYKDPVMLKGFCLSHGPIVTKPGVINLHGHIHGNKNYWIDHEDHIDAFYGLWGGPKKLKYFLDKRVIQLYQNGCKTNKEKLYQDPETIKVPGNLI